MLSQALVRQAVDLVEWGREIETAANFGGSSNDVFEVGALCTSRGPVRVGCGGDALMCFSQSRLSYQMGRS